MQQIKFISFDGPGDVNEDLVSNDVDDDMEAYSGVGCLQICSISALDGDKPQFCIVAKMFLRSFSLKSHLVFIFQKVFKRIVLVLVRSSHLIKFHIPLPVSTVVLGVRFKDVNNF